MDGLIARVEIIIISHGDQNSNWSKITEYQVLLCFIRLPWVWALTVQILILNLCNQDHFSKKIPTNRIARSHFFQLCSAWCAGNNNIIIIIIIIIRYKVQVTFQRYKQKLTNAHKNKAFLTLIFNCHPKNHSVYILSLLSTFASIILSRAEGVCTKMDPATGLPKQIFHKKYKKQHKVGRT